MSLISSTIPHYLIWQINPAQQRELRSDKCIWDLGPETLGIQLSKGPLLWNIGRLCPWQGNARFLGDHIMLLSMFNLYSKAFSSKWQTPTEPSERPVNQKPYEICGVSTLPIFFPPGKESLVSFRFQSSLQTPCLELPAVTHRYLNIVFLWSPRATYWHQLRLVHF